MKKFAVFTLLFSMTTFVFAGSQQATQSKFEPEKIATFAKDVEKYAASKGARAFIIARVGQPKSKLPKGINFTHTAIAVYSSITLNDGKQVNGYAIYNLYQDSKDGSKSRLVMDYPVDFFWGAYELKAGIIIPSPELQTKIIDIIATGQNETLHNPNYSLIANPFDTTYQNCTEHTLDIINSAIYQTTDKKKLKANAQAYFTPQKVNVSRFKIALGGLFADNVTTRDHKGKIRTASFGSIANYLSEYNLTQTYTVFKS